jgi:hypothetical protein
LLCTDRKAPEGYNQIPEEETETMVQFHVSAANQQLQQAYW